MRTMKSDRYRTGSEYTLCPKGRKSGLFSTGPRPWLRAVLTGATILAPGIVAGVNVPKPVKLELEDLVSGQIEVDETDGDEALRTLFCSVPDGKGKVAIRMTVSSGEFQWTIKQGEALIDAGILSSQNGWKVERSEFPSGLYALEVAMPVGIPGNERFRRRIDFAPGLSEEEVESIRECIGAITLHRAGDFTGLLNALEPLDADSAAITREQHEELDWARIESLIRLRKFEEIFDAIEAFKRDYPGSVHLAAVVECEIAALFERGLKMTLESVRFKDASSPRRAAEGRANLQQFLALVRTEDVNGYAILPKRNLQEDLWSAWVVLGEENKALEHISERDSETMEQFELHCALLCPRIKPDRPDENIARMERFLDDHPGSQYCPRVRLDMAGVALREGERLVNEEGLREQAAPYFDTARGIFSQVAVNQEAGIADPDVGDAWEGILRSYYWESDTENLESWSEEMISRAAPGESRWRLAKLYQSDNLINQQRYSEAEAILDELIALGFEGAPSLDGHTSAAVTLRVCLARSKGDKQTARQLVDWVRDSDCVDSIRRNFDAGDEH